MADIADWRRLMRNEGRLSGLVRRTWVWAKPVLLGGVVMVTNPGVIDRSQLLVKQGRFGTLGIFGVVWVIALLTLTFIAYQRRHIPRLFWALMLGVSGAGAWGYHAVSQSELTVLDFVSFWVARHEAGNAFADHTPTVILGCALAVLTFVVIGVPARLGRPGVRAGGWSAWLVPAIPVLMIAGIVYVKSGNGSQAMPKQYSQISLGLLLGYKTLFHPSSDRVAPAWTPDSAKSVSKIIFLVDESIRPDYLDATPGNTFTPNFANVAGRLVNFGQASSGGVCSSYSNAILRMAAAREDVGKGINSNPTLFAYAKKAGYHTIYIDAQAYTLTNTSHLQNFMTADERGYIDEFYPLIDANAKTSNAAATKILTESLASKGKVFLYVNLQGSHFPYDADYPAESAKFHPTITELGSNSYESKIASYRNAISWNTDRFFGEFFSKADLSDAALVYTSDHGQSLDPHGLSHCTSADAKPRMALVPLYAYTSDRLLEAELREGAAASVGHANHFQIAPTLLAWMGYGKSDIESHYKESLTEGSARDPAFTMGDVFGLFSEKANWLPIDLYHNYLEGAAGPLVADPQPPPSALTQ